MGEGRGEKREERGKRRYVYVTGTENGNPGIFS
jgi:hypothetical protein